MASVLCSSENMPKASPAEKPAKMARIEPVDRLLVKKLSENATLPKRGSAGAAGYDLSRYVTVGTVHAFIYIISSCT